MELYLSAGANKSDCSILLDCDCMFLLLSFYELRKINLWDCQYINNVINKTKKFMLDSGAFTFMNSGKEVNWKTYVDEYIAFINKYDIQYFIELDLYGVLGVETTEKIRRYIEHHTGKKPIPVYHGTMPVSYFRILCQKYPYVAVSATGTIESSKWTKNKQALKQIIRIGHSYGTKLHGLGYTRLDNVNNPEVMFDSVDSTAWLSGARFGVIYLKRYGNIIKKKLPKQKGEFYNKRNAKVWIDKQKELYHNH